MLIAAVSAGQDQPLLEGEMMRVLGGGRWQLRLGRGVYVPDYLMVHGVPVHQLGPIFRNSCNDHDRCYGTYLMDKNACDYQLGVDMVASAKSQLSRTQWFFYKVSIHVQAMGYSNSLQTSVLWISSGLYDTAQKNGACRSYSTQAKENGCFD